MGVKPIYIGLEPTALVIKLEKHKLVPDGGIRTHDVGNMSPLFYH